MLLAGIVGHHPKLDTAYLISSILSGRDRKISIIDSKNLKTYDPRTIRNYVNELDKNHVDFLLLNINIADIYSEVFDCLKFDMIIFSNKTQELRKECERVYERAVRRLFSLLDEKGIAIVNVDDNRLIDFLQGMKHYTVTYGFNSKAGITASSIGDILQTNELICCLQQNLFTRNGVVLEPHEFKLTVDCSQHDVYDVLAAASFALVNDIDLNATN